MIFFLSPGCFVESAFLHRPMPGGHLLQGQIRAELEEFVTRRRAGLGD
jgi:hypothetical protein